MSDYISREAAVNLIKELHAEAESPEASEALFEAHERIAELPAADVKPVVRGEWITIPQEIEMTSWDKRCSVCNAKAQIEHNFCPNCGADMREEAKQ